MPVGTSAPLRIQLFTRKKIFGIYFANVKIVTTSTGKSDDSSKARPSSSQPDLSKSRISGYSQTQNVEALQHPPNSLDKESSSIVRWLAAVH